LTRAAAIYNRRYAELTKKFTTPAVVLDAESRLVAIQSGRVTIHDAKFDRYYRQPKLWYWLDIIDRYVSFPQESPDIVDPELFVAQEALTAAHERLKDLLHLGETSEALKLLEAFAAA
jgi:hypothetical protein